MTDTKQTRTEAERIVAEHFNLKDIGLFNGNSSHLQLAENIGKALQARDEELDEDNELLRDENQRLRDEIGTLYVKMLRGELVTVAPMSSERAWQLFDDLRKDLAFMIGRVHALVGHKDDVLNCAECDPRMAVLLRQAREVRLNDDH